MYNSMGAHTYRVRKGGTRRSVVFDKSAHRSTHLTRGRATAPGPNARAAESAVFAWFER